MKGEVGVVEDGNKNIVEAECLTQSEFDSELGRQKQSGYRKY